MKTLIKHTWIFLVLLTGFIILGSSLVTHVQDKQHHTVLNASHKTNLELLAEIEDDETENRFESIAFTLPFVRIFFSLHHEQADFLTLFNDQPKQKGLKERSPQTVLCIFRI